MEAARPWALAFTRQYHWPVAIAVLDGSSVVVRFSTIPDSPVSPFHGTLNTHLSLLGRALALLATIRKQGFAERDPMVEPRSSGTVALPITVNQRVLATVGMTYFTSALDRADVVQRYVPLVKTLADNIAASVSSLQQ